MRASIPLSATTLKSANVAFAQGYRKENIPNDVDVIIIGKNAKLQPETNEEVRAAFASGKLVRSFADVLHEITTSSETIVVAGSYGKSTCTALLAWCLRSAGKDPSYFIGEVTNGFEKYAHRGGGLYLSSKVTNIHHRTGTTPRNFFATMRGMSCSRPRRTTILTSFPPTRIILFRFARRSSRFPRWRFVANVSEPHARALACETAKETILFIGRQSELAC